MKAKGWQRRDLRRSHTHSNSLFSKTRKKEISLQERGGKRFKDEEEEDSKTRRKKQVVSYIGREAWITSTFKSYKQSELVFSS